MRVEARLIWNNAEARRLSGDPGSGGRTGLVPKQRSPAGGPPNSAVLAVWAPRASKITKPGHRSSPDVGDNGNTLFGHPMWPRGRRRYIDGEMSEGPSKPAIVVIHNCKFFRDCLVRCLEISYPGHQVFSFDTIIEWKKAAEPEAQAPEALVFFSNANGSSSIGPEILKAAAASVPVIVMSDNDNLEWVLSVIKSGARGYIPTSLPLNVAVEAVRFILAGGTYVPVNSLNSALGKPLTSHAAEIFTDRQKMVVQAVCKGMANKQIAYELGMSEHTVKVHLRHIMRRLNVRNRTEVAMQAQSVLEKNGGWSPPTEAPSQFGDA